MMQELLDVTVAGNQTLVEELRKLNKRSGKSRKASGAGDGGGDSGSSSDSDRGGGPRRGDGDGRQPARKPRRPDKDNDEKDDREGPGDGSAMVRDIFKSTRRSSFMGADWMDIGDDPGGVPPVAGRDRNSIGDMLQRLDYMHAGSKPDTLTVQHPLTKEDLWLWDPPTVFGLIAFFEKMEEVAQYYRQPIKVLVHVSAVVREKLLNEIIENQTGIFAVEFDQTNEGECLLRGGRQLVTNKQAYRLLRYAYRPKSQAEMDDILSISVWSDKNYEFFRDPTERNIKSNYPEYQTYAIAYLRRFNRLIDILEVSKQFLPAFVMPKDKTEGLIDIFLDGFPNIGHARAVYKQGIKAEKRSDRKIAWVDITKLYMKAIADYGDRKRDALDMEKRFSAEGSKRKVRPPLGVQRREQKRQQERGEQTTAVVKCLRTSSTLTLLTTLTKRKETVIMGMTRRRTLRQLWTLASVRTRKSLLMRRTMRTST